MSLIERPPHLRAFPALAIATLRDLGLTQAQLERYLGLDARNIRALEREWHFRDARPRAPLLPADRLDALDRRASARFHTACFPLSLVL